MPRHWKPVRIFEIPEGEIRYEVFEISRKTNRLLDRYYGTKLLDALSVYNELIDARAWRLMRVDGKDTMRSGQYF